jgi:hypothetical protein
VFGDRVNAVFIGSRSIGSRSTFGVLGKIATLKDADLKEYDRRQNRIEELRKELESVSK